MHCSVYTGDMHAIRNMSCSQTPPTTCSVTMKGVWLPFLPLFLSKIVLRSSSGPNKSSIIVNWEVVRSLEVRNVLRLWQIQSVPYSASDCPLYILVGARSWEGPL